MFTNAITAAIAADIPVLLWGAPGTGKTASIAALAHETGARLEVLIGSTMDPTDLGYLIPEGGRLRVAPPPWTERLRAALDRGQPAWLFLDELTCAPPSVQAALLRVTQERQVGPVDLRGCRIIAAANPPDFAAGAAMDLAAATANRWFHFEWSLDLANWAAGMLAGWGQPQDSRRAAARALVVGYLRARGPSALLAVPRDIVAAGRGWPSPRSWDALSAFLAVLPERPVAAALSAIGTTAAEGLVGSSATAEWLQWVAAADLPDPEEVLAGRANLPTRGDLLAATLDAVVAAALSARPDRAQRIHAAVRLLAAQRPDVALIAASALVRPLSRAERAKLPAEIQSLGQVLAEARR